jgi:CHASE3 domain sensor protein
MRMITKSALRIGTVVLLALVGLNAYLAIGNLMHTQKIAALTLESSAIQSAISSVQKDLTDMETGQRGYLLTADPLYLQPYADAKGRIAADFAILRKGLSRRTERERSWESQVESLADSKQLEMERSIDLRQRGFRRRAFRVVDSNEGMEYMTKARSILTLLSQSESTSFARSEQERTVTIRKALAETGGANACLLIVTWCLFALTRREQQRLEIAVAQSRQDLAVRELQLFKLTSVLSNQARSKTSAIEANARLLLKEYGGFLPRQGHECAEQIKEASVQMERLRQDLLGNSEFGNEAEPDLDCVAVA